MTIFQVGVFWGKFTREKFDWWKFPGWEFSRYQSRFYIRVQFSRTIESSLTKIRKRYFFRCNNISSHEFFSFFSITFCIGFRRTEKKYVKVTDDDICNMNIEIKAKSEIMKRNRNYKKVDKKIWRALNMESLQSLISTIRLLKDCFRR